MSPVAIRRIANDIKLFLNDKNMTNVYILQNEEDLYDLDVLIVGNKDTPYECGFFWFKFIFPFDYPYSPIGVKIRTTDEGRVRFNPNLYEGGNVCLSVINTWGDKDWTPLNSLSTVIVSIQSLVMHENPLINEPGHSLSKDSRNKLDDYIKCVKYHTLRVACLFLVGKTDAPKKFVDIAKKLCNTQRMIELCVSETSYPYHCVTIHHDVLIDFKSVVNTINKLGIFC
jgi:ubiquitin-conjugating enzyme E2 Z